MTWKSLFVSLIFFKINEQAAFNNVYPLKVHRHFDMKVTWLLRNITLY